MKSVEERQQEQQQAAQQEAEMKAIDATPALLKAPILDPSKQPTPEQQPPQ